MDAATPPQSPGPALASDDLAGWKAADKLLFDRMAHQLQEDKRLLSSRAATRYFGDDDLDYFFEEHAEQAVVSAYTSWAVLDYRSNKDSKTRAQRMLAAGLPEPDATLLRARLGAYPTLYRIHAHGPKAGTVTLADVLVGGTVVVHDRLMSENIEDGLFVCARAFQAGDFRFLDLAGPPLGAGMGTEAVDFLRDRGLEFTPEGLRRGAHMLGWLWDWMDEWQANWRPPHLVNTDGNELVWHTASFSVADEAEARRVLEQRPDIEFDEENAEYVWFREAHDNPRIIGDTVTVGRIEFIGDELVLTVNSAEQFRTGREWIEKLPGVVFRAVTTRSLDEAMKDRRPDETISPPEEVEMTPELTAAVTEMLTKHYMDWLDRPLPALGGQTPRQACRTPDGRQQVISLIRTMPDPTGPAPVHVPRREMLLALGLEAEAMAEEPVVDQFVADEPAFDEEPDESPPTSKIGPNEPCPCGSGKKYKKCCGRR